MQNQKLKFKSKNKKFLFLCCSFYFFVFTFELTALTPALCQPDTRVGTTFSQVQCEYLNMDWKKTYIKTLDMGFDIIRLGAYWSRIEKEEGVYDFRELDWQIREAKKRKARSA